MTLLPARALRWCLVPLLLAGCPGTDDDAGEIDITVDPCGFAGDAAAVVDVGERFDPYHGEVFARIEARVLDGVDPDFHAVIHEEGACRYLAVAYGSCVPACEYDEFCTAGDECVAYPAGLSGGTLTIGGLGEDMEIEPEDWSPGTYYGPYDLPGALFDAGDPITAALAGDEFPPVAIGALGVAPMDSDLTEQRLALVDGEDAVISWTPGPDPDACVRVVLNGPNLVHGAPLLVIIECEGPDTGSLTVPAALVDPFPPGSTPEVTAGHDWPHSELMRYTRSTVDTAAGPARLWVRSTTYFGFDHGE